MPEPPLYASEVEGVVALGQEQKFVACFIFLQANHTTGFGYSLRFFLGVLDLGEGGDKEVGEPGGNLKCNEMKPSI